MPGRNSFRIDLVEYRIRENLGPPDRCLLVSYGYSLQNGYGFDRSIKLLMNPSF